MRPAQGPATVLVHAYLTPAPLNDPGCGGAQRHELLCAATFKSADRIAVLARRDEHVTST
jgi:hypothetical protein